MRGQIAHTFEEFKVIAGKKILHGFTDIANDFAFFNNRRFNVIEKSDQAPAFVLGLPSLAVLTFPLPEFVIAGLPTLSPSFDGSAKAVEENTSEETVVNKIALRK